MKPFLTNTLKLINSTKDNKSKQFNDELLHSGNYSASTRFTKSPYVTISQRYVFANDIDDEIEILKDPFLSNSQNIFIIENQGNSNLNLNTKERAKSLMKFGDKFNNKNSKIKNTSTIKEAIQGKENLTDRSNLLLLNYFIFIVQTFKNYIHELETEKNLREEEIKEKTKSKISLESKAKEIQLQINTNKEEFKKIKESNFLISKEIINNRHKQERLTRESEFINKEMIQLKTNIEKTKLEIVKNQEESKLNLEMNNEEEQNMNSIKQEIKILNILMPDVEKDKEYIKKEIVLLTKQKLIIRAKIDKHENSSIIFLKEIELLAKNSRNKKSKK